MLTGRWSGAAHRIFDDEGAILARIHDEFVPAHDLEMVGKHHEIYLSDFRKAAPERRRTILRQPIHDAVPTRSDRC